MTLGNVAAGTLSAISTQAVNGSQLFATNASIAANSANLNTLGTTTASALGGGATYSAATGITGLSYMLYGSAVSYTDVVSSVQALANGAAGPLQYATPGTPSNALNLVGAGGPVVLGNVADGAISATSTQAVNGSQLFSLQTAFAGIPVSANNTSGYAFPTSSGADSLGVGFGANAAGNNSTATGENSAAAGNNASAYGSSASPRGRTLRR